MKTGSEKSSTTTSSTAVQASSQPFFARAGGGDFFAPVAEKVSPAVQMKMTVNKPGDRFEQEADKMANKVMRMPAPTAKEEPIQRQADDQLQKKEEDTIQKAAPPEEKVQRAERREDQIQKAEGKEESIQKAPAPEEKLQKKEADTLQRKGGDGTPAVGASTQSAIQSKTTGGQPLSSDVRSYMEPRFGADFSNVRVHNDAESAGLSNQLSARAFTYQNHVFFSRDQYQPGTGEGKQLLAHELTHTIQQGHAIQRSPQVSTTTTPPPLQRSGAGLDPKEYFAKEARNIPGFTMLTLALGYNPITGAKVDSSPASILEASILLIPGGGFIADALNNHGLMGKAADWVMKQFATVKAIGSSILKNIEKFIKNRSALDVFDLRAVYEEGKALILGPSAQIKSFVIGLGNDIVGFIKEAILKPIGELARKNPAYGLLASVIGKDPITGEEAPKDAEALIGGFMKLIQQEEVWAKMQQTGAIPRAFAWFQQALGNVKGFVAEIPGLFLAALQSLRVEDIILIPRAFAKLAGVFGGFVGRFINWAGNAVWTLLEIIFDVVSPSAFGYIKRTGAALKSILKNPLPFVGNLVKAAKLGFQNFAARFGSHLKTGLIDWLAGSLPGVYIPKSFSLAEVGKFVLNVMGITWPSMRGKIVKALGKNGETIMSGLEKTFDVILALSKGGEAALWEMIRDKLSSLKESVIGGITSFIVDAVVQKAIPKLLAMFVPGAGFISAIISIYDTVMVFVQKIAKIIQVVTAFIDSIVAIAGGAIGAAANRVESILGGLLSLAINFLAGFAGLGKVADKVLDVIKQFRVIVDKAIDAAIAWIVTKAKKLFAKLFGKDKKDEKDDPEKAEKVKAGIVFMKQEQSKYLKNNKIAKSEAYKVASAVKSKHSVFKSFIAKEANGKILFFYTASPMVKVDEKDEIEQEDINVKKLDDGKTTIEERKKLIASVTAITGPSIVANIFSTTMSSKPLITLFNRIKTEHHGGGLSGGFRIKAGKFKQPGKDTTELSLIYFGLHSTGNLFTLGKLKMRDGLNTAELDTQGVLSFDFIIHDNVTRAGVSRVGTKMFNMSYEIFKSKAKRIRALWVRNPIIYKNKEGISKNLRDFIAAKKDGLTDEEAAKKTWTYIMSSGKGFKIVGKPNVTQGGSDQFGQFVPPYPDNIVRVEVYFSPSEVRIDY